MVETTTYLKVTIKARTPLLPDELADEVRYALERYRWSDNVSVEPVSIANPNS